MTEPIRLGTRASTLARTQSATVGNALTEASGRPWVEVPVTTPGDDTTKPLDQPGRPGLFVSTLRQSLLAGEVDVIVHSFKDLPSAPEPGLVLGAVPARADARDALVSRGGRALRDLEPGSVVGTSSPRRAAALGRLRPDLRIVPIRGNVETRIRKVHDGDVDATILAVAGLSRIGRADEITEIVDGLLPAPAQGALAVECRAGDAEMVDLLARLDDPLARVLTTAERQVLVGINAECTTAVAAGATWSDGVLVLRAELTVDGEWTSTRVQAPCPAGDTAVARTIGQRAAARLVAADHRPVLLVRSEGNSTDAEALRALGIPSISEPFVRISPRVEEPSAVELLGALRDATTGDRADSAWLIATSPMAVPSWRAALAGGGLTALVRAAESAGVRAAATGERTAGTLRDIGFASVLVPTEASAVGLLAALDSEPAGRALLPRGNLALPTLPQGLRERGWEVDEAVVYDTEAVPERPGSAELVENGEVAAVVLRSPSAVLALLAYARVPDDVAVVCAGSTTTAAAEEAGLTVAATALAPSAEGVAAAVGVVLGARAHDAQ